MLGEVAHLDVLEKPEGGVSYYADWSGEAGGLAFTSVYEMNLHDMSQRNKLFNSLAFVHSSLPFRGMTADISTLDELRPGN